MKKVISIISGKPNLIKAEPVNLAIQKLGYNHIIIDSSVYNKNYGPELYEELRLNKPKYIFESRLNINYLQLVKVLSIWTFDILSIENPDYVVVYGDLDGGVAGALAAYKTSAKVIHVESGLRNNNLSDTEEMNRIFIDNLADILIPTSRLAFKSLKNEKLDCKQIVSCGNTIIDCLRRHIQITQSNILQILKIKNKKYILFVFHRDENLYSRNNLMQIISVVNELSKKTTVVFIQYNSTKRAIYQMNVFNKIEKNSNLKQIDTVTYHRYLKLLQYCQLIITDSSSIVDEATYLEKRCIIVREKSHRLGAIDSKYHMIVPAIKTKIIEAYGNLINNRITEIKYPHDWDFDFVDKFSKLIK